VVVFFGIILNRCVPAWLDHRGRTLQEEERSWQGKIGVQVWNRVQGVTRLSIVEGRKDNSRIDFLSGVTSSLRPEDATVSTYRDLSARRKRMVNDSGGG